MARRDDLQLTAEGLRSLTEVEIPAGRVISLFVDLDPSEFGVVRARASQVSSLVDGLSRTVEALADDLAHDELTALRSDRDRIRDELGDLDAEGARGLALFACSPADLWEVLGHPAGSDTVAVSASWSLRGRSWKARAVTRARRSTSSRSIWIPLYVGRRPFPVASAPSR